MKGWSITPALAALAMVCAATPALADDPNDPAMRTKAAREADAAKVRELNRAELAHVQARDARYAEGWRAWREQRDAALVHDSRSELAYREDMRAYEAARRAADADQETYASARSDYETAMASWRRDVSACRSGQVEHCAR